MKYQQNAVLTSLRRAQQFFDVNAGAVGGLNPTARKELDDVVAQLSTLAVAHDGSARDSKGETARLRTLHCLGAIAIPRSRFATLPLPQDDHAGGSG